MNPGPSSNRLLVLILSLSASFAVASIWGVGALLMAALCLVAHYLALLLDQARQRRTIVRRKYTREP